MGRNQTLAILFVLIAAHIALAASFASMTPFRKSGILLGMRDPKTGGPQLITDVGAPDERQHVNYVARLAHGGGFPVLDPNGPAPGENYEAHQPPLYYILASGWTVATGIDIIPAPPATEGKDMSDSDGIKLRALNVLIGAITVGGVFMLAYWSFRRPELALVAAAFAALLPMHVATSGAVSNDPLLYCICTWTMALVVHGVRDGWTTKLAVGIGILVGLAILTKTTGLALLPVLLVALFLKGENKIKPSQAATAAVLIAVISVPWLLRNQRLYGDLFAMNAFNQAFANSPQASMFIEAAGPMGYWWDMVFNFTAHSFLGVFGYMDLWLTNTTRMSGTQGLYQITWLLLAAAVAGWFIGFTKSEKSDRPTHALLAIFTTLVVILFIGFNAKYFQAQARYLFPAIGPISCAIAFGLVSLVPKRWGMMLAAVVVILGIGNLFALSKLPEGFQQRMGMTRVSP